VYLEYPTTLLITSSAWAFSFTCFCLFSACLLSCFYLLLTFLPPFVLSRVLPFSLLTNWRHRRQFSNLPLFGKVMYFVKARDWREASPVSSREENSRSPCLAQRRFLYGGTAHKYSNSASRGPFPLIPMR